MSTVPASVSPRRLTHAEEVELLRIAKRLRTAEEKVDELRAERDQLIAELADDKVRMVDMAEVLDVTPKAIWDARNRGRR